jgi:hypothetical protein
VVEVPVNVGRRDRSVTHVSDSSSATVAVQHQRRGCFGRRATMPAAAEFLGALRRPDRLPAVEVALFVAVPIVPPAPAAVSKAVGRRRRSRDSSRVGKMVHVAEHYRRPGWFTTDVFNPVVAALARLGASVCRSRVLEVKGRNSRRWRQNLL